MANPPAKARFWANGLLTSVPVADERQRLGDWEGDTMVRKGRHGFLVTCADRASRYLIARKVNACATDPVAQQLQQTIRKLPAEKRQSLTLDNGREFARPLELEKKLDLPVYFAHPYHAWERGTNENTNGLLRQYLPKGTDLTQVTIRNFVLPARSTTGPANASTSKPLARSSIPGRRDSACAVGLARYSASAARRIGRCWEATRAPRRPRDRGDVAAMPRRLVLFSVSGSKR